MRSKLLLSGVVLGTFLTLETVCGAHMERIPCISSIPQIRLEANDTSIQICNGERILVTQQLCNSENNLVAQLNMLLKRRGGHFIVNLHEGELEFEYAPEVTPLVGTSTLRPKIGSLFIGSVAYGCINGLPPEAKAAATSVVRRAYGEVGYSQATGSHFKVGIAPDTSAGK